MIVHEGKPFDRTAHERFERARRLAHSIGVYEILERGTGRGEDTLWNTGFKFKTQRDLATHLMRVKK